MTPNWTEVNAAVMAVLGEFGRSNGTLRRSRDIFVERLFSLRHAEALVDGSGEVRVAPGTVITPLARDFLRRRRVEIRVVSRGEAARSKAHHQGEWGFAIESRSGQVEAIRRILLDDWLEVGSDSVGAANWVIEGDSRGALVVADEASVATWRAGRVEGVRPATVDQPEAVSRAIRHLGANLIVIEPAGKSIFQVKQVAARFRQGGAPMTPDWIEHDERPAMRAGCPR